jgi:hypothetical protein
MLTLKVEYIFYALKGAKRVHRSLNIVYRSYYLLVQKRLQKKSAENQTKSSAEKYVSFRYRFLKASVPESLDKKYIRRCRLLLNRSGIFFPLFCPTNRAVLKNFLKI